MRMNKKALISAMKNSISNVLETMFFLPVELDDFVSKEELWDMDKDKVLSAILNFSGPLSGHCIFYIPEELAKSVTADFMGKKEKNISGEQAKATVREMANMIAGNAFALYDPESVINLGIPEMLGHDQLHKDSSDPEERIFIAINSFGNNLVFQINVRIED